MTDYLHKLETLLEQAESLRREQGRLQGAKQQLASRAASIKVEAARLGIEPKKEIVQETIAQLEQELALLLTQIERGLQGVQEG